MKPAAALAAGLAGATALTILHETVRHHESKAPRMDLLGMQALARLLRKAGEPVPPRRPLFYLTMAGDVAGNALYYSLIGAAGKRGIWPRAIALGLAAGIGALVLPEPLGLDGRTGNRTAATKAMTVGWYLLGSLVTAAVLSVSSGRDNKA